MIKLWLQKHYNSLMVVMKLLLCCETLAGVNSSLYCSMFIAVWIIVLRNSNLNILLTQSALSAQYAMECVDGIQL